MAENPSEKSSQTFEDFLLLFFIIANNLKGYWTMRGITAGIQNLSWLKELFQLLKWRCLLF